MKKILLITSTVILLLLALMVILPFLFKDKIVQAIKETANKEMNAHLEFSNDIQLNLFSNFPDFTLGIKDISLSGINEFEGDTLISMQKFSASLDIMSIFKGDQIKIKSIEIDHPRINAIVLKGGKANWDITKPSDSATAQPAEASETTFKVALKKLSVIDANIIYDDRDGNMYAELNEFNHTLKGDFSQDIFLMKTLTSSKTLTVIYGGVKYLNKVGMTLKADLDANMKEMKFTFKENEATINQLVFSFNGWYAMPGADMNMDITYAAHQSEFKNFLSLIPAIYAKDFDQLESSGKMAFDGFVKGTYNETQMPAFAFNLKAENGMFKYPALPVPVKDVQMDLSVTNPDGNLDHTKIDLSKLHFNLAGDIFDAHMTAINVMKDPEIDAFFKGRINLANITKVVPQEEGTQLAGIISMDMEAKGKISTLETENYEAFNAKGSITVSDMMYAAKDLPKTFYLNSASMDFNPRNISLNHFDAKIGKSDMHMNGQLSNFFAYAFGKGTIKGVLNFSSDLIDANEFLSNEPTAAAKPAATDTTSLTAPEIPSNIDFTMNSKIGKLLYSNLDITNFNGQIHAADQKLSFNKVGLNTLGSTMNMDGYYETTNPKRPSMNILFGINNLDIQKAFVTFNTVRKLAPIAEKTTGTFSTLFKMNTTVDQHLNPIYEELFAEGKLDIPHADIKGVPLFDKAAETLKYDRLRNPSLNNVHIQFKIEKGRIYTQPFDVTVASQKMTLSGSTGLDQTIDYIGKTAIPRSALGGANNAVNTLLAQANAKAGTGVKLSDVIQVELHIGGTFTSPNVTTNLSDVAKSEANNVKDQLAAEADKKKKELELQAKAEADRMKKEAETKARAEADRLKKEAEAKANAEKEKAKKKAEEEAKKQLKGLFGK